MRARALGWIGRSGRNVIGRIEAPWRPATAEEGFEIVRRRLFEPLAGPEQFKQRDVVARAFADLYRAQHAEFPPECRDMDYENRLKGAYSSIGNVQGSISGWQLQAQSRAQMAEFRCASGIGSLSYT
jgi:hypothetical protein